MLRRPTIKQILQTHAARCNGNESCDLRSHVYWPLKKKPEKHAVT